MRGKVRVGWEGVIAKASGGKSPILSCLSKTVISGVDVNVEEGT